MTSQGNQPNKPDQSNKPQQSDPSRTPGQEKGRPQTDTGTTPTKPDDQRNKGTTGTNPTRKDAPGANSPDVTIPNPKNPGYGDNEPGDPRRMEVDADKQSESIKQNPRRS